ARSSTSAPTSRVPSASGLAGWPSAASRRSAPASTTSPVRWLTWKRWIAGCWDCICRRSRWPRDLRIAGGILFRRDPERSVPLQVAAKLLRNDRWAKRKHDLPDLPLRVFVRAVGCLGPLSCARRATGANQQKEQVMRKHLALLAALSLALGTITLTGCQPNNGQNGQDNGSMNG